MRKVAVLLAVLYWGISACASGQPESTGYKSAQKSQRRDHGQGCLGRSNTDYILTQPEQGNSYELERPHKLRLAPYLGQEIEVTGSQSPSMSTSSDFLARAGSASPVTIRIKTIKTIAKRCSAN